MKRSNTKCISKMIFLILLVSCRNLSSPSPASDKMEDLNGLWEMKSVECGDGVSLNWEEKMGRNPVNMRKQVNNGQTIDYVVDSANCIQTSTGHLVPQGNFLFTRFEYQKYCNEKCGGRVSNCGPLHSNVLTRVQVVKEELLISENDTTGVCAKTDQSGPLTVRYKRIKK